MFWNCDSTLSQSGYRLVKRHSVFYLYFGNGTDLRRQKARNSPFENFLSSQTSRDKEKVLKFLKMMINLLYYLMNINLYFSS
jgi:hypothetical protein